MIKFCLSVFAAALIAMPFSADAQVSVKGYYRSNGTYVQPHVRSSPNNTTADNWSTKGNVNPYTGKEGTNNPPSYVPVIQAPPSRNYPSYRPNVLAPLTTEKERAVAEIMALIGPQGGKRQSAEYQTCYTIYDCQ
jgi:hypothetical protein